MKKRTGFIRTRFPSGESGQALILVLIFLLLGSLMLVPALDNIGTALKTGVKYEDKTKALYAADAGIDDGIWQIKYGGIQARFGGDEAYEYNFTTNASYVLEAPVNGLETNVTIQNVWIPSNVTLGDLGLSANDAKTIIDSEKLVVSGTSGVAVGQPYRIKIDFVPATGDNLTIKSVGAWLPQGFTCLTGTSSLEDNVFAAYYPDSVSVSPHCGGQAIVWSYNSPYPLYSSFPNFVSENETLTSTIYFNYTPPPGDPTKMPTGIAWVTAQMADANGNPKANPNSPVNVPISWDVDTRIYKIDSQAGDTRVRAYTSKLELRNMGDAASGDYVAVGNSLMIDSDHRPPPDHGTRDQLLTSSAATVSTIPSNGDALFAYLYWSGWRNDATTLFTDTCSNFNNWDRSNDGENQSRVPTGDGDNSGTWNTAPRWDDIDETTANDGDYMTGTDTDTYQLFTFSPFSIPAGSAISDLTVYVRAKDVGSTGGNDIRPSIKVNGTRYITTASTNNPGGSFTTYSFTYATNPNTSAAWTVEDINGTGAHPLQQFGVYSSDLSPDVEVSMVYAVVNVGCWTIYNNDEFRGQGSASATTAQRTLTLKNSLNLSSYPSGTVGILWGQSESGTLESADTLYYALSADGGTTWSGDFLAFHDDDPASSFSCIVPAAYMTSAFKMRFYFNFDDSAEYVYLDNIRVLYMPPDTSVTFSINGQQVSLDVNGDPQLGGEVTASTSSVLVNTTGYSYACKLDVSDLVKHYPVVAGEQHHSGNAIYAVGSVLATEGDASGGPYELAYAGWSLVIVYFSPETAGHYLYLRDVFSYTSGGEDLDFDNDGQNGGDITGFVIPEPIRNQAGVIIETNAAKLTCFVGEGDWCYSGDFIALNAPSSYYLTTPGTIPNSYKLWDGITLAASPLTPYKPNSSSQPDNVWNSQSSGMSEDGVDIDTFNITWASQMLRPGDTRLHLDLYTQTDNWNLIYFILSVRSKTVTGGTEHYIILGN